MLTWERQKYRKRKQISSCQKLWVGEDLNSKEHEGILWLTGFVLYPVCGEDYKNPGMCKNS